MVMCRRDSMTAFPHLKVGGYEFSRTKQLKNLGSISTDKYETGKEISSRILSGNKCSHELTKILRSWSLSTKMKKQLYIVNLNTHIYHLLDWGLALKKDWGKETSDLLKEKSWGRFLDQWKTKKRENGEQIDMMNRKVYSRKKMYQA